MIWLTGATGYVGMRVLQRLVEGRRAVRCLVLPEDPVDVAALGPPGAVEVVRGDVTRLESFARTGEGIDTIVHAASLMLPNPADRIRTVNVQGAANVLRFAVERGVRRFVYVSAVSAVYESKNAYGRSKAEAEQMVTESGLDYTILRPTMIYGPGGGLHFQTLVSLIRRAPGVFPILGPGRARLQPVWIGDVTAAVELALSGREASKKTYNVSGATVVTFNELVDRIAGAMGVRRIKVNVPMVVCEAAARVVSLVAPDSFLSPDALHGVNQDATIDYLPFQKECGYSPLSLDEGLPRVFGRP